MSIDEVEGGELIVPPPPLRIFDAELELEALEGHTPALCPGGVGHRPRGGEGDAGAVMLLPIDGPCTCLSLLRSPHLNADRCFFAHLTRKGGVARQLVKDSRARGSLEAGGSMQERPQLRLAATTMSCGGGGEPAWQGRGHPRLGTQRERLR